MIPFYPNFGLSLRRAICREDEELVAEARHHRDFAARHAQFLTYFFTSGICVKPQESA
jgi:hypothetical protein